MQSPDDRSRETQELIERFQRAAARRRRMHWLLGCCIAAVVLGAVAVIVVLTRPGTSLGADADPTSTSEVTSTSVSPVPTSVASGAPPTSSTMSTTTSLEAAATTSTERPGSYVVVIDPGHQAKPNSDQEPIGPGSTQTKAKVSSGTRSVNTGSPESELVLTVALKLRNALEAEGITVVMTRTSQDVDISNMERAQVANAARADLFVRIHADGATDTSVHGILMLYPASIKGWTDDIAADSKRAARLALDALVAATGARDRGLSERGDITGFNWSDVPVILPEIGLMTNPAEDALLATDAYQDKIVRGLTEAILNYLGVR